MMHLTLRPSTHNHLSILLTGISADADALADKFIKGCPEVQSLAARSEVKAAEPKVVVRLFLIVAQAAHSFLRSVDHILPAPWCEVMTATEAAEVQ